MTEQGLECRFLSARFNTELASLERGIAQFFSTHYQAWVSHIMFLHLIFPCQAMVVKIYVLRDATRIKYLMSAEKLNIEVLYK